MSVKRNVTVPAGSSLTPEVLAPQQLPRTSSAPHDRGPESCGPNPEELKQVFYFLDRDAPLACLCSLGSDPVGTAVIEAVAKILIGF
jgi:hypothetical protein